MATTTASAHAGTKVVRVAVRAFAFIERPVCVTGYALVKSEVERADVFAASGYTT